MISIETIQVLADFYFYCKSTSYFFESL